MVNPAKYFFDQEGPALQVLFMNNRFSRYSMILKNSIFMFLRMFRWELPLISF